MLGAVERSVLSLPAEKEEGAPYIGLKYFHHEHECFSMWTADELKQFSAFNRKVNSLRWEEIIATGGRKGTKQGLGCTHLSQAAVAKLPHPRELKKLSPDLQFLEMRITKKARAIGFRLKAVFFLVWLDRNHDTFPV